VALRAEKGKQISTTSSEQLRLLASRIDDVKALVQPTPDTTPDELQAEFLKFVAFSTQGA
jgi:hypothetical protein